MSPYREPSRPETPRTPIRIPWGRVVAWTLFVLVVGWVMVGRAILNDRGYHFNAPRAFR